MVEGFCAQPDQAVGDGIRVGEHVLGGNAQDLDALLRQPSRPHVVSPRPVAHVMRHAINLDRELPRSAVKVEHVRPDRVLLSDADFGFAQPNPKKRFRQAHLLAKAASLVDVPG